MLLQIINLLLSLLLFLIYLVTGYKIEDIRDDHCEEFCRDWLFFLGIKDGKTWNFHSSLTLLALTHTLTIWSYTFIYTESEKRTEALHHISLSLLALGLFLTQAFNHEKIISLARQSDNCFKFGGGHLEQPLRKVQKLHFTSWMKIYTDLFSILVFFIWCNLQRTICWNYLFANPIQPPPGMILPFESEVMAVYLHVMDIQFVLIACFTDVIALQIFMKISLQITANFQILGKSLSSIKYESKNPSEKKAFSVIHDKLRACIKHHQEIFATFSGLKTLFDQMFYLLYFSIMGAIVMCRTLLIGNIDVGNLIPIFYLETGYLHTFCALADAVAIASENIRFAAYESDWPIFTRDLCRNIRMIVIRASKIPRINFYFGGSDVSCATFTMIINASLTYFMVSILMDKKDT